MPRSTEWQTLGLKAWSETGCSVSIFKCKIPLRENVRDRWYILTRGQLCFLHDWYSSVVWTSLLIWVINDIQHAFRSVASPGWTLHPSASSSGSLPLPQVVFISLLTPVHWVWEFFAFLCHALPVTPLLLPCQILFACPSLNCYAFSPFSLGLTSFRVSLGL